MLLNALNVRITAFAISELLRENQESEVKSPQLPYLDYG